MNVFKKVRRSIVVISCIVTAVWLMQGYKDGINTLFDKMDSRPYWSQHTLEQLKAALICWVITGLLYVRSFSTALTGFFKWIYNYIMEG